MTHNNPIVGFDNVEFPVSSIANINTESREIVLISGESLSLYDKKEFFHHVRQAWHKYHQTLSGLIKKGANKPVDISKNMFHEDDIKKDEVNDVNEEETVDTIPNEEDIIDELGPIDEELSEPETEVEKPRRRSTNPRRS